MATLRSALRRLAPAARCFSKGGRGSSGPSVTSRRTFFSNVSGSKSPVYWEEQFSLKSPATWFVIFGIAAAATYRIKVRMINQEKRTRARAKEEEERGNRVNNPIT